jgi:hypothetical protein
MPRRHRVPSSSRGSSAVSEPRAAYLLRLASPTSRPLLSQEDVTLEELGGEGSDELRLPDAATGEVVRATFALQNHSDGKHFRWAARCRSGQVLAR